jgi:hypothetical protein
MSKTTSSFTLVIIIALLAIVSGTGCASAQKNKYSSGKGYTKPVDTCDLTRMGKNKYFYSTHYKKNLKRSLRKIGG